MAEMFTKSQTGYLDEDWGLDSSGNCCSFNREAVLRACLTAVALVRGLIVSWLDCTFSAGSANMATFGELWEIDRGNVYLLGIREMFMFIQRAVFTLAGILIAVASIVAQAETPIPRSMPGDKGKYFLLEKKKTGSIVRALHKRIGVDSVGYTLTELTGGQ